MPDNTEPTHPDHERTLPSASHEGQLVAAPGGDFNPGQPEEDAKDERRAGRQLLTGRSAKAVSSLPEVGLSPARLAWREMRKNRFAMAGLGVLLLLYTLALFAPFLAPYDAQDKSPADTQTTFHPPMRLRFVDASGNFSLRPFVYQTVEKQNEFREIEYLLDAKRPVPVQFFVKGDPYKLFWIIPSTMHFVGVPSGSYLFLMGTDKQGYDYLSRLLVGAQISLSVGLIAIFITFTLGLLVGGASGFYGGRIDNIIMRGCEILMSVPDFYLLLALAAMLPPDWPPARTYIMIIMILSFVGWAGMARIIRGMVLSVREREYVEAARSLGVGDFKIITRHILPSTFTYAIVAATMAVPGYILGEAGLAFLGLGIRDPVPSWGNMLSDAQQDILQGRLWILAPGLMIFITTLAFNFLGDGLRDALDPKSRR